MGGIICADQDHCHVWVKEQRSGHLRAQVPGPAAGDTDAEQVDAVTVGGEEQGQVSADGVFWTVGSDASCRRIADQDHPDGTAGCGSVLAFDRGSGIGWQERPARYQNRFGPEQGYPEQSGGRSPGSGAKGESADPAQTR